MTNLKKEFFFLNRQLKKRFYLLLLAIVACILCALICDLTATSYTASALPEHHAQDINFTSYRLANSLKDCLLYKYEFDGLKYKVSFVLPLTIAACFMYVMIALVIFSLIQRLDWFRRFLLAEANQKVANRRAAMIALKKELYHS